MEKITFSTAALTQTQQRRHNEDCYDYLLIKDTGCWVVADGLGGHHGGEVASKLAVESIIASFQQRPEVSAAAIHRYLEAAQQSLLSRQQEETRLSEMGTTVVLLVADEQAAMWGHIGDSRLYHLRRGRIANQTRDHSVSQALANAGEIKPEEVRFHEDRHRLLRALGQEDNFRPVITQTHQPLEIGDAFLLCTDGFWELVLEAEMQADFNAAINPQDWLEKMQKRIIARSLKKPDRKHDNFTALAVCTQKSDYSA